MDTSIECNSQSRAIWMKSSKPCHTNMIQFKIQWNTIHSSGNPHYLFTIFSHRNAHIYVYCTKPSVILYPQFTIEKHICNQHIFRLKIGSEAATAPTEAAVQLAGALLESSCALPPLFSITPSCTFYGLHNPPWCKVLTSPFRHDPTGDLACSTNTHQPTDYSNLHKHLA